MLLQDLLKDEYKAGVEQGMQQGIQQGMQQGIQQGEQLGVMNSILMILSALGEVPAELEEQIRTVSDTNALKNLLQAASKAQSIEAFKKETNL